MQLFGVHLEDFIKIHIINGDTKKSPIVVHLNMTGYDTESLSAITCIKKIKIDNYISTGEYLPEKDFIKFDHVFELPYGTFKREYNLWADSVSGE